MTTTCRHRLARSVVLATIAFTGLTIAGQQNAFAENTPAGSDVWIVDFDPALLVINEVSVGGTTSYQPALPGPALQGGYVDVVPQVVREFTTTASVSGPFWVCVPYSGSTYGIEADLRLMWLDPSSSAWVDVTTDWRPSQQRVCGVVPSLEPVRVAEAPPAAAVAPPSITPVSVSSSGAFGNGDSASTLGEGGVSADGRFVVFDTHATNLGGGVSTNYNVYRRDVMTGQTELVNVASDGISYGSAISADGRYVTYTGSGVVRVRDMQATSSVVLGSGSSADVNGDGRWVVYVDNSGTIQVHDRDPDGNLVFDEVGTTTSPLTAGFNPRISPNGRFVMFVGNTIQSFVIDRDSDLDGVYDEVPALPVLVNAASDGTPGNDQAGNGNVADDGDVAFWSFATNLGGAPFGATPAQGNIFVRDFDTGAIELIGQMVSNTPMISSDGRFVSFDSFETNGLTTDTNGWIDVFRYDRLTQTLQLASLTDAGGSLTNAYNIAISGDGLHVAFGTYSAATPADSNGAADLYLASFPPPGPLNTPTGSGVSVTPDDTTTGAPSGVTLTFGGITAPGETMITSSPGPSLPSGFQAAGLSFEIQTTALYQPPIVVCFDYSSIAATIADESALLLLHYGAGGWEDITTQPVDTFNNIICGLSSSLSPFTLATIHANHPPTVTLQAPTAPVQLGSTVNITATLTDDVGDQLTCTIDWGDGAGPSASVLASAGHCIFPRSNLPVGVYSVTIVAADQAGATASAKALVVVYDANGGFVTGGGWINSPAGAYAPAPTLTGKATFGFVAKYKKGATVPTGDTDFQFSAGAFSFRSTDFEWLVVAGSKAKFKGTGTVNGVGGYSFLITAVDDNADQFRIRIWNGSGTVYDNKRDVVDETSYAATNLGGGSIIVHKA